MEGKQEEPGKNMEIPEGTKPRIIIITFFLVAVSLGINATSAEVFESHRDPENFFPIM